MKNPLSVAIIVLVSWGVYSQNSPSFTFEKTRIVFADHIPTDTEFSVFKGKLSLQETAVATPMLGELSKENEVRYFSPLIPFSWGQEYSLVYNNSVTNFRIDLPKHYQYATVKAVYPTSSVIPSNILKFHIQFSKPINQTNSYEHIYFLDSGGNKVDRAILPLENVLISEDGTLLTLWIEPGRQKRGLTPNLELGQVFSPSENYTLVISKHLKDENGIAMQNVSTHQFRVLEADRTQPSIDSWEIKPPKVSTTSYLVISCNEALDFVSATGKIIVNDEEGKEFFGKWQLTNNDTTLVFIPEKKWSKGRYWLQFDERLDDLAGNNLVRLFDSELNATAKGQQTSLKAFRRSFRIE